ncbi:MAG: hypothetical protein ABEJ82_02020 [Haloplanus sp.]
MDRAQADVVGKALEVALAVLFVGLVTTLLYGGVVPAYGTAAGDAVAERTVALAAERTQQAVPAVGRRVNATARVDLPTTIAGAAYEVRVENRTLVLDHPDPEIGARAQLALPGTVETVDGRWRSGDDAVVRVRGNATEGLTVRLTER